MRLLALPEAMRDHGVDVVEVAGWQTRGIAFPQAPIGGIDHWTVGAATGELPSAAILTYGRSDLPGPLCNVARGRRTNGRIRAYMIASGKANHAGRGRWQTTSGRVASSNYDLFGLEVEYRPWSEPIHDEDLEVDARIHAAAAQVCGYQSADVAGHHEYATPRGRKVDRQTVESGHLRSLVNVALTAASHTEDDMTPEQSKKLDAIFAAVTAGGSDGGMLRPTWQRVAWLQAWARAQRPGDPVDEQAIAQAVLDGLDPAAIAAAIPADLAARVADELAARLAD